MCFLPRSVWLPSPVPFALYPLSARVWLLSVWFPYSRGRPWRLQSKTLVGRWNKSGKSVNPWSTWALRSAFDLSVIFAASSRAALVISWRLLYESCMRAATSERSIARITFKESSHPHKTKNCSRSMRSMPSTPIFGNGTDLAVTVNIRRATSPFWRSPRVILSFWSTCSYAQVLAPAKLQCKPKDWDSTLY